MSKLMPETNSTQNTPDVAKEPLPSGRNPLNQNPGSQLSQRSPTDAGQDGKKKEDRDSSLKIKIELDLDVEVHLTARIKGDITIGLL
jgi:hypothetical protein